MTEPKPARIRVSTFSTLLLDVNVTTLIKILMRDKGMLNPTLELKVETTAADWTQIEVIKPDDEGLI